MNKTAKNNDALNPITVSKECIVSGGVKYYIFTSAQGQNHLQSCNASGMTLEEQIEALEEARQARLLKKTRSLGSK